MSKQDTATAVYSSISLLEIKRSARLLSELEPSVLADFVEKYSAVLIFLLNVLDRERSQELLGRMADDSIVSVVEEELRALLIREVARVSTELEKLIALSGFLEAVDRPAGTAFQLHEATGDVLELVLGSAASRHRRHFGYLDAMGGERLEHVLSLILAKNPHTALGLLVFAATDVTSTVLDEIARKDPALLAVCPTILLEHRFRSGYELYARPEILRFLPDRVKAGLLRMQEISEGIHRGLRSLLKPGANRQQRIDAVSQILSGSPADLQDLILAEMVTRSVVSEADAALLRAALETITPRKNRL